MELDDRDDRKTSFHNRAYDQPAFERISSKEIRIRGIDLARQILRGNGWRQAGFMADLANRFTRSSRAPVLFQEGEAHRKQRSATARFFAPKVVAMRYRQLMDEQSARIMRDFRSMGRADLDSMGMELSVAVTAEIVGLNDSSLPGLAKRLNSFLADEQQRVGKLAASLRIVVAFCRILRFFFRDVMPTIRSHRIQRREDIISLLIEQGYSTREILTECITYGAAGVATTRELIVLAAWHLFDRPELRKRFLDGDEAGRIVVLEEVLRLEPVVGTLYRRAERDIILNDNGRPEDVSAGTATRDRHPRCQCRSRRRGSLSSPARSGSADSGSQIAGKPDELWRWRPSVSRRGNRSARKRNLPQPALSGSWDPACAGPDDLVELGRREL